MQDFFSELFFSLKAKPKILLVVTKPFSMVLPPLVGLFFFKWSVFEITRTSANFGRYPIFYIKKFELRRQGGNIEHFQSFKKAGRTP
jgi:hypothetical protein